MMSVAFIKIQAKNAFEITDNLVVINGSRGKGNRPIVLCHGIYYLSHEKIHARHSRVFGVLSLASH